MFWTRRYDYLLGSGGGDSGSRERQMCREKREDADGETQTLLRPDTNTAMSKHAARTKRDTHIWEEGLVNETKQIDAIQMQSLTREQLRTRPGQQANTT